MARSCGQVDTLGFSIFFIDAKEGSSKWLDSYCKSVCNSAVIVSIKIQ